MKINLISDIKITVIYIILSRFINRNGRVMLIILNLIDLKLLIKIVLTTQMPIIQYMYLIKV